MAATDPSAAVVVAFLCAHPDALDGVRYVTLPGETEPAMTMNTATMTRFLLWAVAQGSVTRPELVPELLGAMSRFQMERRS